MKRLLLICFIFSISYIPSETIAGSKYTTIREEIVSGVYIEKRTYTKTGKVKSEKFVMKIEGMFWDAVKNADGSWDLTSSAKTKLQEYKKGGGSC
jgi:hypothetical protein